MNNLSMHILDIVQNSISANATKIEIRIRENLKKNLLDILIKDNGEGMDDEFLAQVTDPYTTTRTTRKIGMGIPLLKHSAEQSNGYIKVYSEKEKTLSPQDRNDDPSGWSHEQLCVPQPGRLS